MRGFALLGKAVGAIALAALLVVGATAVRVWQVARQDHRPASDAIIVLGGAQYDGRPSSIFEARLDHALDLYEAGVAPRVITVGGNKPGDRFTEAEAGAQWLRDQGVPGTDVVAVGEGNDTLRSLQAVATVFDRNGWSTAVLVTDPWHALRSQRMANDAGVHAVASPTRQGPAVRTRGTEMRYIARETGAYLFYRLFHTSSEAGPDAV